MVFEKMSALDGARWHPNTPTLPVRWGVPYVLGRLGTQDLCFCGDPGFDLPFEIRIDWRRCIAVGGGRAVARATIDFAFSNQNQSC
jgi:hypothetical protein